MITSSRRLSAYLLLFTRLAVFALLPLIPGAVQAQTNNAPTGLPVVMVSAESPGVLAASTWRIADADGLPYTGVPSTGIDHYNFNYQWIRVDDGTDVNVGTNSLRYQLADAEFGKRFKVRVTFTDRANNDELLTSVPLGPVFKPPPLASTSTLVGNTGQTPTATRTITGDYAMNFRLGSHGQGYDIRSVAIDLAAAPSSLSVSLWTGGPHGGPNEGTRRAKLYDFENPPSFQAGLNQFTAPAGVHALQNVNYWIVLSGFGGSLSITETSSDAEDAGNEPGASLANEADGGSSVVRLAVQGARRTSGTLAANFAQPTLGGQEIISLGDKVAFGIDLGAADLYLVRGMAIGMDDTTPPGSGFDNPFSFRSNNLDGAEHFDLYKTRNVNGLSVWTAPQGATVAGGGTYLFDWDDLSRDKGDGVDRVGAILTRLYGVVDASDGKSDFPPTPGVSLAKGKFLTTIDNDHNTAVMAVYGEPLNALAKNLGQANNGFVSVGTTNTVVAQGFSTGSETDGYPLTGIGVNIEGSGGNIPDDAASVSAAIHASSWGKPGTKLFDLLAPTDYAAGVSFFEAPRGTVLEPDTAYVLVWTHQGGSSHRLQRTLSDSEDSGNQEMFWIGDSYYRGADVDNLTEDANSNALEIAVYGNLSNKPATGQPVIYPSADGAGLLVADTFGIEDPNGLQVYSSQDEAFVRNEEWTYQWLRVDAETGEETEVGDDFLQHQPVEADVGHRIRVRVSFTDQAGFLEARTSVPFGPIAPRAGPSRFPSTLVGNVHQTPAATASITQQYAQGFRLGSPGQGYEITGVTLDLAAAPSSLKVSLWIDAPSGYEEGGFPQYKVFDFANPPTLVAGLNKFTAPPGALAYQNVNYHIVLSDFGSTLSIRETTSDAEDAGGEAGAVIGNSARVRALGKKGQWSISDSTRASSLRLFIEGSRRASGFLASSYGQVMDAQEIISKGDKGGAPITLGDADRYLIRGFSWISDDTTPTGGGIHNPFDFRSGWTTHPDRSINSEGTKHFGLIPTRFGIPGVNVWTAPQGSTVTGNRQYMYYEDFVVRPLDPVLTRVQGTSSTSDDPPTAPGVSLAYSVGDWDVRLLQAFLGEPLVAMVQNLGQADAGFVSTGTTNTVLAQGFTTGSDGFGYRLQGIGVNLEGSDGRVPDNSAAVSVAVHASSGGQPGAKLFDLVSPTEYAPGHSFYEAPAGAYLDPTTDYVLVWTYNYGAWHRLQRTASNGQDSGARTGASIANAYHLGAGLDSLSQGSHALELAVYTEVLTEAPFRPGEILVRLPTQALVSNVGQTSESNGYEANSGIRYAPSFNTGAEAATLDSIELDVETAPTTSSDVSVAIHGDASGDPGTKLYDLTNPSTIGTGTQKFTASARAPLAANTKYYVVISSSSSAIKMSITNSNSEDDGGAEGWTLDDDMHFSRGSWTTDASVIQMRVNSHFTRRVTPTEVEPGWPLVPDDVAQEGGVFRLLFLTSTKSAATDTDIETYNTFVQEAAAAGHDAIQPYREGFRAVASTGAVDAVTNTYTTGTDVPIYWLDGNQIAHNYSDFYDGTWDEEEKVTDESGSAYGGLGSPEAVWTGSNDSGVEHFHQGDASQSRALGAATAERGGINNPTRGVATPNPLYGNSSSANTDTFPLYAISEVFTVGPNPAVISELEITSDPGSDGMYRTGDEIEVTATFEAPVAVRGEPRVKLRLGQGGGSDRWAEYQRGGAVFVGEAPERVLVSKWEGPPGISAALDATTDRHAQAFTTGAEPNGYRLDSIGIHIFDFDDASTVGDHLTVTLNQDDSGDPGAVLCTLSDPISFTTTKPSQFGAAACPTLSANTTYFVVIERVVITSDRILASVQPTVGDFGRLDDGGLPDWSIAESRHSYASNAWSETSDQSIGIQVTGAVASANPAVPLVKNTGQTFVNSVDLTDEENSHAQTFTTGADAAGYTLGSIGIDLSVVQNKGTAGDHLVVTLNAYDSVNDAPGDVLCTLSDPASFIDGVNTFEAPSNCPTLEPSTTYVAVVERVTYVATAGITLALTTSNGEDTGSAAGWSIGNGSHAYTTHFNSWAARSDRIYQIEVKGAVAPVSPILVKNTEKPAQDLVDLDDATVKAAQGFTTGSESYGYQLNSIGIEFVSIANTATAGDHLVVTLNSDGGGRPGGVLCTLGDPDNFVAPVPENDLTTFEAPACPPLSPDTTYFVVVDRAVNVAADTLSLSTLVLDEEDAGAAAGWSIGNNAHTFSGTLQSWAAVATASLMIEVSGAPLDSAPDRLVFTYTVQAEDESGPDGVSVGVAGAENAIDLNGGAIVLAGSELDAVLDFTPRPGDGEHLVNVAGPELVAAVASRDGSRLKLTFDQALNPESPPRASHFTVLVDGEPVTLSEEAGSVDELPAGSPLIPAGLGAGDEFRLLFLTSTTRDATSTDIADYNSFVQTAAAGGLAALQPYSEGFRAVGSTGDVDARDNARTTYTDDDKGVPIYWLGGKQIADDYEDFHDGTWAEEQTWTDESGTASTDFKTVWTGSDDDGTEKDLAGSRRLGASLAGAGWIAQPAEVGAGDLEPNPLDANQNVRNELTHPLYALSQVFVVPRGSAGTDPDYLATVSGRSVLLDLAEPLVSPDQEVTVSYRDPSAADDTGVVEDVLGNDAPSFGVGDQLPKPVENRTGQRLELLPGSSLLPSGAVVGDRFRLLFITSSTRDATSAEIEDYNLFVQAAAAAGRADIREFSDDFYAVASTGDVDARDNTGTTYTASDKGVPIYWLGGNLIAEDYADFYDGEWDDEVNRTDESGGATASEAVWTGSRDDGTKDASESLWLGGDVPKSATGGSSTTRLWATTR